MHANDNQRSKLKDEIAVIQKTFEKEFGKTMACLLEQYDFSGTYRKINIHNLSPKKLVTVHWFVLFTLDFERKKKRELTAKLKAKLKVYSN
jgi:hypothetical protein